MEPVKAKVVIKRGNKLLFTGTLTSKEKPEWDAEQKKLMEDLFNLERYINTQGAYRCHVECDEKDDDE